MKHQITETELNDWLRLPQWQVFASSADRDGSKRLEIDGAAGAANVLRVTVRGQITFLGTDKRAAVEAYNNAT